ncbi:alpha-1,4-glucan--maltose-1-phosphate maltosyltransferase [Pusillimonas sp. ANT_WB101]|uniref:alpha-1,4-glucan--maltose-1-phosphate maltosyltransferase n=1 Tax=Pusillimonas sp. ANT_WB101 TaxID=2597356 RepID=UPI0011ED7D14|nr:alpha-1,4-glucan--maltose-1-phosphate maltosyltransferase [Pusillimonas sp. ANT_WB101]KAA0911048.1 alpha-1,4-glucan--maltose-1-phosphate maltosyltransferase [Pusillimonas sp. ANT_WB101]
MQLAHNSLPPYRRLFHVGDSYEVQQPPEAGKKVPRPTGSAALERLCRHASEQGCDSVLFSIAWLVGHKLISFSDQPVLASSLAQIRTVCRRNGLAFLFDFTLTDRIATCALEQKPPESHNPSADHQADTDPLIAKDDGISQSLITAWAQTLSRWAHSGLAGVRCCKLGDLAAEDWSALMRQVRSHHPDFVFMAWTPGLTPQQLTAMEGVGFDATFLSLPWWDGRQDWLLDERLRLRRVAPVLAPVDPQTELAHFTAQLVIADFCADGIMISANARNGVPDRPAHLAPGVPSASASSSVAGLRMLTGPLAGITALARTHPTPGLLAFNPGPDVDDSLDWPMLQARLPDDLVISDIHGLPSSLPPWGHVLAPLEHASPILSPAMQAEVSRASLVSSSHALNGPRIVIERITPAVDDGLFSLKRCLGEPVTVQADVLMDGHDQLATCLLWKAADETQWSVVPMQALDNDRWVAGFRPRRLGRHVYCVQAWWDSWQTFRKQLQIKAKAGQDVRVEVEEGRQLVALAIDRIKYALPTVAATLSSMLNDARAAGRGAKPASTASANSVAPGANLAAAEQHHIDLMLSDALAAAMRQADGRPFETRSAVYPLYVDRRAACYASWYELFPRSQGPTPGLHGRFVDVLGRLPMIAQMGFDVLYFPPIHPIGLAHRKGKNNALQAGADDPGSPYAIGSAQGGHDALHPELGTLDEFCALIDAAGAHGLEIAMDFAIQCSPDHPWLEQHPQWFSRRPDGSLRYAENPPKRYEDIVNPDFYGAAGSDRPQLALWQSLRDVVLFWAKQGIRIFRVDNPHTKPLPFWQWLIAQVQAKYPETVFLAEAFTRPKMMHRLAKLGFTQSYTYFTWRNDKEALTSYLTELSTPPVAEFFRPNFFVNTPDINPYFLQSSGRPGFLIRAALACTLSGLWGMYNGFELCEAASMPGKEEYLDSEKYQLRHWDMDRPGNIIAEISQLNRLRRNNPALQTHLGVAFHEANNDHIIFYSKSTVEKDNIVLVAVSLDPHASQRATLELPLWLAGIPDDGTVYLHDLLNDHRFRLSGKFHTVELNPDQPYLVWRVVPAV